MASSSFLAGDRTRTSLDLSKATKYMEWVHNMLVQYIHTSKMQNDFEIVFDSVELYSAYLTSVAIYLEIEQYLTLNLSIKI